MRIIMKMRDRVMLALYGVLGLLIAAALGAAAFCKDDFALSVFGYSVHIADGIWAQVVLVAAALVLLIWSIRVIMLACRREPRADKSCVSVQNTENGAVHVSVQAVDTLVRRALGDAEGVVDINTRVVNHEDSISVEIEMTLESDVHIPNITMLMQRTVKNYIEEFAGIAVREVTVTVKKIVEVTPQPPLALAQKAAAAKIPEPQPEAPEAPEEAQPAVESEFVAEDEPAAPAEQPEAPETPETPDAPEAPVESTDETPNL